jgi:hypothetical protein
MPDFQISSYNDAEQVRELTVKATAGSPWKLGGGEKMFHPFADFISHAAKD